MRRILLIIFPLLFVAVGSYAWWSNHTNPKIAPNETQNNSQQTTTTTTPPVFDKTKYSLTDPVSLWVVVNKKRPIPESYVPSDLTVPGVGLRLNPSAEQMLAKKEPGKALEEMLATAKAAGFNLVLGSGYRSSAYQRTLYNGYVASGGQASADKYSARPGHSEHQTGLAIDIDTSDLRCHLEACFGTLPEGKWLAEHANEYGFILRYPVDKASVTGYEYEPWHFRYVGRELAAEMKKQNITTLEEFFSLSAAPTY